MSLLILFIIISFLAGIYFCGRYSQREAFKDMSGSPRCPNVLIQKDAKFYLFNSKLATVPGVNPVVFNNLEEYTEFLDWQRGMGIRCPVLYLQHTYDAQGQGVFKPRPNVNDLQGGLPPSQNPPSLYNQHTHKNLKQSDLLPVQPDPNDPYPTLIRNNEPDQPYLSPNPTLLIDATRNDPPYNKNSYPAYDESSYYVGTTTPLDAMNKAQESLPVSPDPMDPNWGGAEYTQKLVDQGYYADNEVMIRVA